MSHIVTIKTRLQDPVALRAACQRLGLAAPTHGAAQLFSGEASGFIVQLPNWAYPAVVDTDTGQVYYDNYNGQWGDAKELGLLLQAYAAEKARIEARKAGHTVTEKTLADGSIQLAIHTGATP